MDLHPSLFHFRGEFDHARLNRSKYTHDLFLRHQIVHVLANLGIESVQEAEYECLNVHRREFNSGARMTTRAETDVLIGLLRLSQEPIRIMRARRRVDRRVMRD
jgi:hypothetical protein